MNENIESKVNIFQKVSDWFVAKTDGHKAVIILLAIILFFIVKDYKDSDKAEKYLDKVENKIENCEEYNNKLERQNIKLEKDVNALAAEIIVIKASAHSLPFPYWIKNLNGKMLYLNKAYELKYLKPLGLKASDYINHYDWEIWGEEIGEEFFENDMHVYRLNKPQTFTEKIDGLKTVLVTKYPYTVGTQVFGIAGVEYENFSHTMYQSDIQENSLSFESKNYYAFIFD